MTPGGLVGSDDPAGADAGHRAPIERGEPAVRAEGLRAAARRLTSLQKPAGGAPGYSRYVNRRIGRYLAAAAYVVGLRPNQVTALSALCSAAGITVLATVRPGPSTGVLVTGLLLLGYALDSADGQLARLRRMSSTSGEWLDHMVDCVKISSMHLAVLVGLYRFAHLRSAGYLLVPLGFCVVTAALFFGMTLNDQLRRAHAVHTGVAAAAPRDTSRLRSLVLICTDFGTVCAIFLVWGWPTAFLIGYAALFAAHAAFLALASVKWFRDMQALDARRS
jgi:phosphatidylglycerophosphate synthase